MTPRFGVLAFCVAAVVCGCGGQGSSTSATVTLPPARPAPTLASSAYFPGQYMLVLGDSISTGFQAGDSPDTQCQNATLDRTGRGGWACLFLAKLQTLRRDLEIDNEAVNGEDTCSFFANAPCGGFNTSARGKLTARPASQAAAMQRLLKSHGGRVSPITFLLGVNDLAAGNTADSIAAVEYRYDRILGMVRKLAPRSVLILLDYYRFPLDTGSRTSVWAAFVSREAKRYGAVFVDISRAFAGKMNTLVLPDGHPSNAGQRVIADLVWKAYERKTS